MTSATLLQGAAASRERHALPVLLPARFRVARAPRVWQELVLLGLGYYLYSLVRAAVPDHKVSAFHRADSLLSFEHHLHVDIEHTLNAFVASVHWLATGSDYYYATLHFIVTLGVLVWLWRWHPLHYRSARTVIVTSTLAALVGFYFFALAPPRLMHAGFVDTIVKLHTWGSWGTSGIDADANQFAAMPSLHIAWALWCALIIATVARRTWVRVLAAAYPAVTFFVIIGTANHFVLDAVGGAAALGVGFLVQRLLTGRPALTRPRQTSRAQP